jgi:membrane-bound metal-dependent hydrolase YbcI (DUF457 family)
MFAGHYGPALAAKSIDKSVPLWVLFIAVQWLDVCWTLFVLLGIEKVRIAPGITAANPLDLYYMPYSHSLAAAILWSLAAAVVYRAAARPGSWATPGIVAAAVFSHWLLDLVVHRPDLALYDDAHKAGLGLWNYPLPSFFLEAAILLGGLYGYVKTSRPVTRGGRYGMTIFALVLVTIQGLSVLGPPPPSVRAMAVTGLTSYILIAGMAYWLERKRV